MTGPLPAGTVDAHGTADPGATSRRTEADSAQASTTSTDTAARIPGPARPVQGPPIGIPEDKEHKYGDEDGGAGGFSAPEPVVHEVLVPETITVGALAQKMSDRAVRVIQATEAGELLPRGFAEASHFECKFCSYAQRCWGGA